MHEVAYLVHHHLLHEAYISNLDTGKGPAAGGWPEPASLNRNESQSMYFHKKHHGLSCAGPVYTYVFFSNAQPRPAAASPMGRHGPWPVARARRDCTASGRLERATGPGTATGSLTRNESQSMYFHKGNHGLSCAGSGYIYVILSNAQPEAPPAGLAAASAAFRVAGPGPGAARGGDSLLAGGEASVIDPAGPAESGSDSDRESDSESQGSDPENLDQEDDPGEQLKCAIMFKIMCNITENVQNCC